MNKDQLLSRIDELLKQYFEPDIEGDPVDIDCDVIFAKGVVYRWNRDKGFDIPRADFSPEFEQAVKELQDQGYAVGYSYKNNFPWWAERRTASDYVIIIYSPDEEVPFKEYNGFPVRRRKNPPVFV